MQKKSIYHEKQSLWLCGLHSVNNLLGRSQYTREQMNKICEIIRVDGDFINPHKGLLGLGDYDANIIIFCLQEQGLQVHQHYLSNTKLEKIIESIKNQEILGLIILKESSSIFQTHHWYSIRKIDGKFFNLDSRLDNPEPINSIEQFLFTNQKKIVAVFSVYKFQQEKPSIQSEQQQTQQIAQNQVNDNQDEQNQFSPVEMLID